MGGQGSPHEELTTSMARTLSDTVIVAMIEAATRLASGRAPVTGSSGPAGTAAAAGAAGRPGEAVSEPAEARGAVGAESTVSAAAEEARSTAIEPPASRHDTRSAEQIGADFKTIYRHIEEVVRESAEQETRAIGF